MCWVTKETPQSKLAEKDIHVFKIVKKGLQAYYRNFRYSIGEVFKTEISFPIYSPCKVFCIYEGFHSYSSEICDIEVLESSCFIDDLERFGIISKPYILVFYKTDRLDSYMDACILECVIPKGSIYYLNHKGEYVSNQIKPIKVKCVG